MNRMVESLLTAALFTLPLTVTAAPPTTGAKAIIKNALSAAPARIAAHATVKDWNDHTLRAGNNGWVCYPDMAGTPGNDPMCLDGQWAAWAQGWMNKQKPAVDKVGVAYMLMGGSDASNDDPFAKTPKPGEKWLNSPAHIMIVVPDPKQLDDLPSDPKSGGPWVMYKGTPYAHIMVPVK